MKALSIKQPWLDLIIEGVKTIETRSWRTKYRGPLLLCASGQLDQDGYDDLHITNIGDWLYNPACYPRGQALAVCEMVDNRPMIKEDMRDACCCCESGLYAWVLANVRRIEPFRVKGRLRLFNVDDSLITYIQAKGGK